MTEKHKIASIDELESEDSRIIRDIEGKEIALFKINGEYHAVLNYCIHQAGPLCEGRVTSDVEVANDGWSWNKKDEDEIIACAWHGWKFNIKNGRSIDDPKYKVPTYDTKVEDGEIYVLF